MENLCGGVSDCEKVSGGGIEKKGGRNRGYGLVVEMHSTVSEWPWFLLLPDGAQALPGGGVGIGCGDDGGERSVEV